MEQSYEKIRYIRAANDDAEAEIVPGHLAARRTERRIMAAAALLAIAVLTSGIMQGMGAFGGVPAIVTNAFLV